MSKLKTSHRASPAPATLIEWLDRVPMNESDREVAKNQIRLIEGFIDAVSRAGRYIGAAVARTKPQKPRRRGHDRIAPHLH